ncbi:MAG: hypothetical protein JWR61_3959 [Ferruginibacter sp.]|nr:hypothetical protein [Ferruginibacter sp.]
MGHVKCRGSGTLNFYISVCNDHFIATAFE